MGDVGNGSGSRQQHQVAESLRHRSRGFCAVGMTWHHDVTAYLCVCPIEALECRSVKVFDLAPLLSPVGTPLAPTQGS